MRPMAKETHIKTDKNPLSAGVLGSYVDLMIYLLPHPGILVRCLMSIGGPLRSKTVVFWNDTMSNAANVYVLTLNQLCWYW